MPRPTAAVAVGDFNGDGRLDAAFTMLASTSPYDNGTVGILFGNGDGTMTVSPQVLNVEACPLKLFASDFNHDGVMDLAVYDRYITTRRSTCSSGWLRAGAFR